MAPPALQLCEPSKASVPALREYLPDGLKLELRSPPKKNNKETKGMSLTFASFVFAGAVPPYSDFLLDVLRYYHIQLAHLTPFSIANLSVFAHLCVKWLNVPPSLDLFRLYYVCCPSSRHEAAGPIGSCFFQLQWPVRAWYIHVPRRKTYYGWSQNWFFIQDLDLDQHTETAVPTTLAVSRPSWTEVLTSKRRDELESLRQRVAELRRSGLTGDKVMLDAVKHRLAPLRNEPKIFPGDAEADLQQTQIRMFRIFGNIKTKMTPCQKKMAQEWDDEEESADGAEDDEEESADDAEDDEEESADDEDHDHDHVAVSPGGHDGDDDVAGAHQEDDVVISAAAQVVPPQKVKVVRGKRTTTDAAEASRKAPCLASTSSPTPSGHHHHLLVGMLDRQMSRSDRLENELEMARHEAHRLASELGTSRAETQRLADEVEKARQEAERLASELGTSRAETQPLADEVKRARQGEDFARQELLSFKHDTRNAFERSKTKISSLEAENKSLRSSLEEFLAHDRLTEDMHQAHEEPASPSCPQSPAGGPHGGAWSPAL